MVMFVLAWDDFWARVFVLRPCQSLCAVGGRWEGFYIEECVGCARGVMGWSDVVV